MESFFQRLYKFRQSDFKNQKEDFLTEILSYCLTNDPSFRINFLKYIGINYSVSEFKCKTQFTYKAFGRTDILINVNTDTIIIIECKIDSRQRPMQLNRYSGILKESSRKNKYLIYLTKYREEVSEQFSNLTFVQLRWFQIYGMLLETKESISKELISYLKTEKMSKTIKLEKSEISYIKNYQETISKMNEFLYGLADSLNLKSKIKYPKKIEDGEYGITTEFHNGRLFIGFYQFDDHEQMKVCVAIENIPHENENFSNLNVFMSNLGWHSYDIDKRRYWLIQKDISDFFDKDEFLSQRAYLFIEQEIEKIKSWIDK